MTSTVLAAIVAASALAGLGSEEHAPIVIQSDEELGLPDVLAGNGVRGGTGTSSDPYRISNWTIRPPDGSAAVTIRGTSKHVVFDNLTILSAAAGSVVVDARAASNLMFRFIDVGGKGGIVSALDIHGLEIRRTLVENGRIVVTGTSDTVLAGNQVFGGGISAFPVGSLTVSSSHVRTHDGNGIVVNGIAGAGSPYHVLVIDNRVEGNPLAGIALSIPYSGRVCGNDVQGPRISGISVSGGPEGSVEICWNHVTAVEDTALRVQDARGVVIQNNTARESGTGMSIRNVSASAERNFVVANRVGIALVRDDPSAVPIYRGNLFLDNDVAAYGVGPAEHDLRANYWGTAEDPKELGERSGMNGIEGDVQYRPWCLDPRCTGFSEGDAKSSAAGVYAVLWTVGLALHARIRQKT